MPQNAFCLRTRNLLVSQKTTQRHFFPTLHPLSTVNFATSTVLAFVLLRDSRFNFHCYTQREATPTQKSARKCAATSRDFLRERLPSAFTLANQLRWIAQYLPPTVRYMLFENIIFEEEKKNCLKNKTSHNINSITRITRHCHANILPSTGQENSIAQPKKISYFASGPSFDHFSPFNC